MSTQRIDGRDARWTQHRTRRRRELVESTLRAIRKYGAQVGMDDIAAEAATSKTVIYRHFQGRTGLYLAVVDSVDQRILANLEQATRDTDPLDIAALISAMVDGYLQLVEKDHEIYRFVVTRPILDGDLDADPVAGLTGRIGAEVTAAITRYLRHHELDTGSAPTWGHGVVGFIRAATDHWLATDHPRSRAEVVTDVRVLFDRAFPTTASHDRAPLHAAATTPSRDEDHR